MAKLCLMQRPPGPHWLDPGSTGASLAVERTGANRPSGFSTGSRSGRPRGRRARRVYLGVLTLNPRENGVKVTRLDRMPLLWEREAEVRARLAGRTPAVFLDYDGTLTPIVED